MKDTPIKCYVVEGYSGSYDDARNWIAGIYLNAADAEEAKDNLISAMNELKDVPCPFKEEDFDSLTEEQETIYENWSNGYYDALDFNTATVTEYEINKSLKGKI